MKKSIFYFLTLTVLASAAIVFASAADEIKEPTQAPSRKEMVQRFGFIDENGDGINDLARDSDNDGIPNCLDPDWIRPQNGSGYKHQYGYKHRLANARNQGASNSFNIRHEYSWQNNWGGCNSTNICDNSVPNVNQVRNRKRGRRH